RHHPCPAILPDSFIPKHFLQHLRINIVGKFNHDALIPKISQCRGYGGFFFADVVLQQAFQLWHFIRLIRLRPLNTGFHFVPLRVEGQFLQNAEFFVPPLICCLIGTLPCPVFTREGKIGTIDTMTNALEHFHPAVMGRTLPRHDGIAWHGLIPSGVMKWGKSGRFLGYFTPLLCFFQGNLIWKLICNPLPYRLAKGPGTPRHPPYNRHDPVTTLILSGTRGTRASSCVACGL